MELLIKLLLLSILAAAATDFTAQCPVKCQCKWALGNKQAACSNATFRDLSNALSPEIQILDLSAHNRIQEINEHAFEKAQLINLKRLLLKDCGLHIIHKNAFSSLAIMIELDLSRNNIENIHPETFKDITKIRSIILNNNRIEKLENGLFNNLQLLQKVDLSNNRIKDIGVTAFKNLPRLTSLKLNSNLLQTIKIEIFTGFTTLYGVEITENPWKCDCNLLLLNNFLNVNDFDTTALTCAEPAELQGKSWSELQITVIDCQ